jgi:hypothetical protein
MLIGGFRAVVAVSFRMIRTCLHEMPEHAELRHSRSSRDSLSTAALYYPIAVTQRAPPVISATPAMKIAVSVGVIIQFRMAASIV